MPYCSLFLLSYCPPGLCPFALLPFVSLSLNIASGIISIIPYVCPHHSFIPLIIYRPFSRIRPQCRNLCTFPLCMSAPFSLYSDPIPFVIPLVYLSRRYSTVCSPVRMLTLSRIPPSTPSELLCFLTRLRFYSAFPHSVRKQTRQLVTLH